MFKRRLALVVFAGFVISCSSLNTSSTSTEDEESDEESHDIVIQAEACADGATCSLDDTMIAASVYSNPLIILPDGSYEVSDEITGAVSFESEDVDEEDVVTLLSKQSKTLDADCTFLTQVATLTSSKGVIISGRDGGGLKVNLTDSSKSVSLRGVQVTSTRTSPFTVSSGGVQFSNVALTGSLVAHGMSTSVLMTNVYLAGTTIVEALGSVELERDPEEWDNKMYVIDELCEEAALVVKDGAIYAGTNVEILDHDALGVCVDNAKATFCNGEIHDIDVVALDSGGSGYGRGAIVQNSGYLVMKGTYLHDLNEAGVLVREEGSRADLTEGTSIQGVEKSTVMVVAVGVAVQEEALLETSVLNVTSTDGPGIYLTEATATLANTTIDRASAAGVMVHAGRIEMANSIVQDTQVDASIGGGLGVLVDSLTYGSSSLVLDQVQIEGNSYAGVAIYGDGEFLIRDSEMRDTIDYDLREDLSFMGHGVFAVSVCSGLDIQNTTFENNDGAHVFLANSNLFHGPNSYDTVGELDFVQQDCDSSCTVTPLTTTELYAEGLTSSHEVDLCVTTTYQYDALSFSLYLGEVEAVFE